MVMRSERAIRSTTLHAPAVSLITRSAVVLSGRARFLMAKISRLITANFGVLGHFLVQQTMSSFPVPQSSRRRPSGFECAVHNCLGVARRLSFNPPADFCRRGFYITNGVQVQSIMAWGAALFLPAPWLEPHRTQIFTGRSSEQWQLPLAGAIPAHSLLTTGATLDGMRTAFASMSLTRIGPDGEHSNVI